MPENVLDERESRLLGDYVESLANGVEIFLPRIRSIHDRRTIQFGGKRFAENRIT